jgi:YVTN family beta-propeller protein
MKRFLLLIFICTFPILTHAQWRISAPAESRYCIVNPSGETIIPNGRIIKPLGKTYRIAPHPYGMVMSNDGKTVITANSGTNPFSISILQNIFTDKPAIKQIPNTPKTDDNLLAAVFMGLAISPDNRLVYVAGGQTNKVFIFDIKTGKKVGEINCNISFNDQDYSDGYLGDLTMTADGSKLYVLDQIGFRIVVIDMKKRAVIDNVNTGRYPFGITLSPDEKSLYVANVGMFEYSLVKNLDPKNKNTYLKKPPFGFGTKEMREGVKIEDKEVAGLGDPNAPESFSVWAYDLSGKPKVTNKIKTGILVGEMIEGIPAVGGSSPNSLVATDNYVFVSNGNNDNISVIDPKLGKITNTIDLQLDDRLGRWKGVIPFGLALSPDQKRLYVAESGINAVGVIDIASMKTLGHLPVGWFPSKLKVSKDNQKLVVANAKGFGSGPNGGSKFKVGEERTYIGSLMKGSVTVLSIPKDEDLRAETAKTIAYNFKFDETKKSGNNPIPSYPREKESPIKYIVYISKENRTYDEVFGQIKQGNGDPSIARYGVNASFSNKENTQKIEKCTVMPNHLSLAKRFGTADNFYVDSDHSADGHRWLSGVYPNEWMETHVSAAYGGKRDYKQESKAPGHFALNGSSGSFYPEDYNQDGSMWEHFERHNISFHNYGFTTEQEGNFNDSTMKIGGEMYGVNYPLPNAMYKNTEWQFPTYNMAIPDQFRADIFIKDFKEKFMGEGKTMPQVVPLMLPNDHGAGERPYWKNMVIIVTEDDSQGGIDHVDAHRSILQIYSPYAKKNYVSHQHFSFGSIFKTMWNVLGVPYLNQYDAGATDLSDFFTDQIDYTPYDAVNVDKRIFDPQKALTPIDEKFDWKALKESPIMDDDDYLFKTREEEDKKELEEKEFQSNPRLYKTRKKKKQ